ANGLYVVEGSLVLNSSVDADSIQLDNAMITRFNDASLSTSNLSVSNMTFNLDGTDNVSDSVSVSNATLNILTPTSLAGSFDSSDSIVNIEADTSLSYLSLYGSTLNLNANLDLNSGTLITNGGTINQNGNISGNLDLGWTGEATTFNRTSGTLTLDSLRVYSGSSLALGSGDSVGYAQVVGSGSTLIVDSPFSFANGLYVVEGSLVLNSSVDADSIQLDNAMITRFNDASLSTSNLWVSNMTFNLDGTDNISDSVSVYKGTLNVLSPTSLAGSINSSDSMINIEADTSLSSFSLNDSTLNLNANLDLNSGTLITNGGTINQNGNISGNLDLGWTGEATTFNRTSGTLTLDSLRVGSGSTLDLTGADTVHFIAMSADSELRFTQLAGQTTGLDLESLWLDSDANLTVIFDNPDYNGFNWGLRAFGDRQSEMNDWLAGGQLSSNFAGAGIFYDVSSFGDYTYFGAFSAVPEPASISLVFLALACGTVRMRRRRVGQ
ncbi:MAG: PEP-CTERM sorting domain-containing protein, partial [Pirellula sp.]